MSFLKKQWNFESKFDEQGKFSRSLIEKLKENIFAKDSPICQQAMLNELSKWQLFDKIFIWKAKKS